MFNSNAQHKSQWAATTLAALGVVFGDIGTSPLYALRECFHGSHGIGLSPENVFGVLSLITWSLIIVISIKYLVFVLRADNRGEGGILALMSLLSPRQPLPQPKLSTAFITALGLFGAALLYGDGVITPAISVLSAIEGLSLVTPLFDPYVLPITAMILVALFFFQSHGTARIGKVFGPVVLLWFLSLALLGLKGIVEQPAVLAALSPRFGLRFLMANQWHGFVVLGSVFLVVTGGEALYADLGHFGRSSIQAGWFFVALPALMLQYFGQGALLLRQPQAIENPFFHLAPAWALLPLVILATAATIIASQAVITGAFSLSQQAVQLGYLPRLRVTHTSAKERGQIYVPAVNWALLLGTLYLVLEFRSSSRLAAAYGIAVTTTMIITTLLTFMVMLRNWRWSPLLAVPLCLVFLSIDFVFFGANSLKIFDGGWFPLLLAGAIFLLMTTWKRGRSLLAARLIERARPLEEFMQEALPTLQTRIPGSAIFLTATPFGTPAALIQNTHHNQVVHENVVVLTILTEEVPHVASADRLEVLPIGAGFYRVIAHFGFMESPDVPQLLQALAAKNLDLSRKEITFFLGRETLIATERAGMPLWRERLFAFMSQNSQRATDYFNIAADQTIEIGTVVEL